MEYVGTWEGIFLFLLSLCHSSPLSTHFFFFFPTHFLMPNSRAWLFLEEFHKYLIGMTEFWASARKVLQADFRPIIWLINEIWADTNVGFWQGCGFRRGSLRWVLTQSCRWGTQAQRRKRIYAALMTAWLQSPGSWSLCWPPCPPSRDSWHPVGKEWFHLAWAVRPTFSMGPWRPFGNHLV